MLRSTVDTQFFANVVERVRIGKTGEAYILNEKGILQTQRRSGGNLMEKDVDNVIGPVRFEGTEIFLKKNQTGEKFLYATTWLQDKKWLLVVRREEADAFRDVRSATYVILMINAVVGERASLLRPNPFCLLLTEHGLQTPCVRLAAWVPQDHATLGSGCQHALPGKTAYLPGPTKEFLLPTVGFPPRLCLVHTTQM